MSAAPSLIPCSLWCCDTQNCFFKCVFCEKWFEKRTWMRWRPLHQQSVSSLGFLCRFFPSETQTQILPVLLRPLQTLHPLWLLHHLPPLWIMPPLMLQSLLGQRWCCSGTLVSWTWTPTGGSVSVRLDPSVSSCGADWSHDAVLRSSPSTATAIETEA